MTTSSEFREYYDSEYYKESKKGNPAYDIYDELRVKNIRALLGNTRDAVLIVGCGSNRDTSIAGTQQKVFAFDLSVRAVSYVSSSSSDFRLFAADALQIPFEDGVFDLVVCSEVLEHIPDIHSAVKELRRVMKPGGTLVVSSPNWISFFGLARFLGERITRKRISSDDQPYDDWKTWYRYRSELSPEFDVLQFRGVWYLPPLHFRKHGVPKAAMQVINFLYAPIERLLSRWVPAAGHLIVVKCKAR